MTADPNDLEVLGEDFEDTFRRFNIERQCAEDILYIAGDVSCDLALLNTAWHAGAAYAFREALEMARRVEEAKRRARIELDD